MLRISESARLALAGALTVALVAPSQTRALPAAMLPDLSLRSDIQEAFAAGSPRPAWQDPVTETPETIVEDSPQTSSGGEERRFQQQRDLLAKILPETRGLANAEATQLIVADISRAERICGRLPREYRHSCLAQALKDISERISKDGDYADASRILEEASRKIEEVARANIDTSRPRLRVEAPRPATPAEPNPDPVKLGPLVPVRPEALPAVDAAVGDILDETATQLLRSGEGSEARQLSYLEIAEAVGSTKVLLRS